MDRTDALNEKLVAGTIGFKWCPETESNRHVLLGTRDFKSRASASFAIRAGGNPVKRIHHLILIVPFLQFSHSPIPGVYRMASPGAMRTNGRTSGQMGRFRYLMLPNVLAPLPQPRNG